jgi:hypothetical protein
MKYAEEHSSCTLLHETELSGMRWKEVVDSGPWDNDVQDNAELLRKWSGNGGRYLRGNFIIYSFCLVLSSDYARGKDGMDTKHVWD